jgi:hypothetical protein
MAKIAESAAVKVIWAVQLPNTIQNWLGLPQYNSNEHKNDP